MLSIGYINKWPPEQILEKASEFAARICEIEGAIPIDPNFYISIIGILHNCIKVVDTLENLQVK